MNPGRVMLQILPYAIAVLLTFLVTLSAFPAVSAQVLHHLLYFLILTSISSVESPDVPLRELEGFPLGPVDAIGFTATIGVERVEGWEPGWSCLVLGAHIYKVCCC